MDWTNKSDTELERYEAEESGIVLKTDAKKCKVCGYGDVSVVIRDKIGSLLLFIREMGQ